MAVSKEILDLIPEGCKVNWNEKQQRFYVYKSTYYLCLAPYIVQSPDRRGL